MGGDTRLAVIRTSTPGHRRLIVLKDSFGNTLPGYLFYSFSEIHVIESRYFTKNMKSYVAEHKITDILFANNIFKAYSSHIYGAYLRFLSQRDPTPPLPRQRPPRFLPKCIRPRANLPLAPRKKIPPFPTKRITKRRKKTSAGTETPKSAAHTGSATHHSTTSGEHSSATSTHAAPAEKKSEE